MESIRDKDETKLPGSTQNNGGKVVSRVCNSHGTPAFRLRLTSSTQQLIIFPASAAHLATIGLMIWSLSGAVIITCSIYHPECSWIQLTIRRATIFSCPLLYHAFMTLN
jgi:hypothetical protein